MKETELQEKNKWSFNKYLAKKGGEIFKFSLIVISILLLIILLAYYSSANGGVFVLEKAIVDFWLTITIYFLSLLVGVVFTYYFLYFRRYQFQNWQYLVFLAISVYYLLLRFEAFETQWRFIDLFFLKVLDPFALLSLPIFGIVFYRSRDKDVEKHSTVFLEDNPLESEEDTSSYTNLLEQIKPILYTDKYEKSFSVAIVELIFTSFRSFYLNLV